MKRKKWLVGLLAVVLVLAVGVTLALVGNLSPFSSDEEGAQAQEQVSIEQAMESVRQFENDSLPDLELVRIPDRLHSAIELRSGDTTYGVNPETGIVELVIYGDNIGGTEVLLPMEEAEAVAATFARRHYQAFPSLTLIESELLDHGASKEYLFTWIEIIDGVPTPNKVFVSVNSATGKVIFYVGKYQSIEPFASPSVSDEKAKDTARDVYKQETGVKDLKVGEPALEVIFVGGKQHLAWKVEVREVVAPDEIEMGAYLYIDACTGTVLQVFGF